MPFLPPVDLAPEITTAFLSLLPVGEIRLGLPWGIFFGHLPPVTAFFWATFGNLVGVLLAVAAIGPVVQLAERSFPPFHRLLQKIFARTRHHHSRTFNRFGVLALVLIGLVPLPGFGAYTGVVLAYLFGLSPRYSFLLNGLGVVAAGVMLLGLATGAHEIFAALRPA